ncbi:hypothetical protein CBS147325_9867 [Penicillium roqueforti]|nr:hypothetical protein CBS147325_9867 [Penicillium roqueforti]KAI3148801.1 hypothetical protein DTO046C5_9799 [Penicillium roqueforti]
MVKYNTSDVIKAQMAELNDLVKEIAVLDSEMTNAASHKWIGLCQERMRKTSRMETLKEQIQCKIMAMDVHRKKTLTRQLNAITKVRGWTIDADKSNNTKTTTAGTAPEVLKHGNEEECTNSTLSDDWVVAKDMNSCI